VNLELIEYSRYSLARAWKRAA